jgi:hypothetical protein
VTVVDRLPPASAPWSWDCYTNQWSWLGTWLSSHTMTHTTAIAEVGRILALGAGRSLVNPESRECMSFMERTDPRGGTNGDCL